MSETYVYLQSPGQDAETVLDSVMDRWEEAGAGETVWYVDLELG